jgi:hypothetical protein
VGRISGDVTQLPVVPSCSIMVKDRLGDLKLVRGTHRNTHSAFISRHEWLLFFFSQQLRLLFDYVITRTNYIQSLDDIKTFA